MSRTYGSFEKETRTDKKFLVGIIPDHWTEDVYEADDYWSCYVRGERLSEEGWSKLFSKFKDEFQENLIEVYSFTSNGVHFVVYLRKTK